MIIFSHKKIKDKPFFNYQIKKDMRIIIQVLTSQTVDKSTFNALGVTTMRITNLNIKLF